MADFNTHIFGAAATVSLGATCCTKLLSLTMSDGLMLTATGLIGGILPDIDLKQSQPSRVLFSVLGIVVALVWLFASIDLFTGLELWLGAVAVYLMARFPFWWLFHRMTVHRGSLHSLVAAFTAGVIVSAIAWQQFGTTELQSWLLGVFMFFGYVVHLLLDELYSVDFTGIKINRSFGSAMKPIDFQQLPASCLIIFIGGVAWFWSPSVTMAIAQWNEAYQPWEAAIIPTWLPVLLNF